MGQKAPFPPGLSPYSQNRQLKPVSAETAIAPADAGTAPPPRRRRARQKAVVYLTIEEIQSLFRAIKSVRDTAAFRLIYHRGLRRSELGLLQLSDFRARDERINVHRLKGSNSGEDLMFAEELRALKAWVKVRGNKPGPLFPSRQGGPITGRRLDQLMKRYCRAAGIPGEKAHCHALKHSAGTHYYMRTRDILAVKAHLGHRNIQNTLIYISISDAARDEIAERNRDWK